MRVSRKKKDGRMSNLQDEVAVKSHNQHHRHLCIAFLPDCLFLYRADESGPVNMEMLPFNVCLEPQMIIGLDLCPFNLN